MGYDLFKRIAAELAPYATPDTDPKLMGRTISVGFQPKSAKVLAQAAKDAGKVIDLEMPEPEDADDFEEDVDDDTPDTESG